MTEYEVKALAELTRIRSNINALGLLLVILGILALIFNT